MYYENRYKHIQVIILCVLEISSEIFEIFRLTENYSEHKCDYLEKYLMYV